MQIHAAVITVSDSTHAGTREDKSGPAVVARLEQAGYRVAHRQVVPDERALLADLFRRLPGEKEVGVIFTTGGTGVSARDITPEATRDVIEKELPGFGELMRAKGLASTKTAVLSRAVSGIRGTVLIVNLPGSTRGAVESIDAILELVPHVLDLINGRTGHKSQ
jgi:molybdopterin adenylyltransferase